MMRKAVLAAAQISPGPGDTEGNLARIARWTERAGAAGADLVCFPEVCLLGSPPESIPGPGTERLGVLAKQHGCWLIVGMAEANPDGKPYNSAVVLDPEGKVHCTYRKMYLFTGEREGFTPGTEPCLIDLPFGRAAVTICYDFIFPGYISGLVDRGAELILHATNWVTADAWVQLGYDQREFRAVGITRAIENTVWFLSSNRYGPCDSSATMCSIGQSAIIGPAGKVLAEVQHGEGVAIAEVDFDSVKPWREQVARYLEDRRSIDPWGA